MSEKKIKELVNRIYQSRKLKLTNPEGYFDARGRWFPSPRENAGDGMTVQAPTVKSRYTYRIHCRSKHHVRILVGMALQGMDVPDDIKSVVFPNAWTAKQEVQKELTKMVIPGLDRKDIPEIVEKFMAFIEEKRQHANA